MEILTVEGQAFELSNDTPVPENCRKENPIWAGLASQMKIGQSVRLPEKDARALVSVMGKNGKQGGYKASTRKDGDGYMRVWKIERVAPTQTATG